MSNHQMNSYLHGFLSFFNGMASGWAMVFVMQPFDIIKVRMQTQVKGAIHYNGIGDCLLKIIRNQGFFALWKGSLTPLLGQGLLSSSRFGVYQTAKKHIRKWQGRIDESIALPQKERTFAAFVSGFVSSIVVAPTEHTRIRIQIQKSQAEKIYSGSVNAGVQIYKKYGLRTLFRGMAPSAVRQSTGITFYFTVIENLSEYLSPKGVQPQHVPLYVPLVAGGVAGFTYWGINYPFDYVKTIMQSDKLGDFKYPTMMSCFRQHYQKNGWKGFYKGYSICMLRAFPVNGVAVASYRLMQRITGHSSH